MNTLETSIVTSPSGKTEECAKFVIDDATIPFGLTDIAEVGQQYTLSLWIMADAAGNLSVANDTFEVSTEWKKHILTFTAEEIDLLFVFGGAGTYYIYHPQLEIGNKATDWTPAPEDMATAEDLSNEVKIINKSMSELKTTADSITARVTANETKTQESLGSANESIEKVSREVSTKMTAEAVEVQIRSAMEQGAAKVVTSTGYIFDDDGMTVQKSGREMKTQITEDGMTVYQKEEAVLTANSAGVDARNLHATTYLIVGKNSRFEDYGTGRTGCFWIGG